ncbi:MAG: hypothetical protein U9N79_08875 [Actinomycetota bacterium]|nr:hypothetical protein [Actinomycetota bacterium]
MSLKRWEYDDIFGATGGTLRRNDVPKQRDVNDREVDTEEGEPRQTHSGRQDGATPREGDEEERRDERTHFGDLCRSDRSERVGGDSAAHAPEERGEQSEANPGASPVIHQRDASG